MRKNEASKYLETFKSSACKNFPYGDFDYKTLARLFEKSCEFDCPDRYAVYGDTIYIFEHFRVDASQKTKGGSLNQMILGDIGKEFRDFTRHNADKHIFAKHIKVDASSEYYVQSVISAFDKHYWKIPQYKKRVRALCNYIYVPKYVVVFVIEDASIGVAQTIGGDTVTPFDFLDFGVYVEDKENVDVIIYSSFVNSTPFNMYVSKEVFMNYFIFRPKLTKYVNLKKYDGPYIILW